MRQKKYKQRNKHGETTCINKQQKHMKVIKKTRKRVKDKVITTKREAWEEFGLTMEINFKEN